MKRPFLAAILLFQSACSEPASAPTRVEEGVDGGSVRREAGTIVLFDAAALDAEVDADLKVDGGFVNCATSADGMPCKAAPDACHLNGVCKLGKCMAPDIYGDGTKWSPGDDTARCCGGDPTHITNEDNCGACGILCNLANGETCQEFAGHYFCRGCETNSGCWSGCCSTLFSPYSCAASDCKGNCDDTLCPSGAHCELGNGLSSNYCTY